MPVRVSEIQPNLELYARLESREDADISAAVEADVLEVLVQDGDRVAAGQELLVLDNRDVKLELLQREADVQEIRAESDLEQRRLIRNRESLEKEGELLALTESNAERARSLFKDGLLSQANVDDTAEELKRQQLAVTSRQLAIEENEIRVRKLNAQLRRAQAVRDMAKLTVDRTRIVAPFAGSISQVQASIGDRVRVGDSLMRLHNPDSLELRTQVPTRYAARVRDALTSGAVMNAVADVDGQELEARLQRISAQTREGSGSVDAYLTFVDLPPDTQLGGTVRVLLSLPAEPGAIAVPAEAVYGRSRIYVAEGGRMAPLDVERLGERQLPGGGSEVIIRSPQLDADAQIITTKISNAASGLLVTIRDPAGDGQSALLAGGTNGAEPAAR
jgi:RND family efflux transporter MFP subunit